MRHCFCRLTVFTVLLFFTLAASAQDTARFTVTLNGKSFQALVRVVEQSSAYHFYYDPAETDSLTVAVAANRASLSQLLDQVFDKTVFHYAIDGNNRVFITKKFFVNTSLPAGFFNPQKNVAATPVADEPPVVNRAKEKLKAVAENKVFDIGTRGGRDSKASATLAGYVKDAKSGDAIIGASVYLDTPAIGVNTDQFGYYSLTLSKGPHVLTISSVGMKDARRQVMVYSDGKLDIELQEFIGTLKTVIVSAEKRSNTRSLQMGVSKLNIKLIKQVPVVFGEADILKVVLSLPGVTSTGEASNGFNVRGGSTDQNLLLFNDATIYNPSHLFGFFSAFNPDVVKGIELYKSAIPEKYGGRLSSVLDVSLQDGNKKEWTGTAGIGPLTGKFSIQGPIKKEKTTLIAGLRTTYSNWLLNTVPSDAYKNSRANFNDANLRITHTINEKNTLYLTGYMSNDKFNLNNDTTYKYGNTNANLKWKHNFNNKSYAVFTAGIDHYKYNISSSGNKVNAFKLGFDIKQDYFRADFNYAPNYRHAISYGFNTIFYKLHPGSYTPQGAESLVAPNVLPAEQALESALYLGDQYSITPSFSVSAGLRYVMFNYFGPGTVNNYAEGLPRDTGTIVSTRSYAAGKIIKTYQAPEIRIAFRYAISDSTSLKLSFNTLQQYIHSLSNTVNVSPTDIWKLSDPHIKPQQGQQVSLGLYRNFKSNTIETSLEVYYKRTNHFLDYKSGARLLLNSHIETDVISTRGKAYGVELLIKKNSGKINGWLSYAFSRTFLQVNDPLAGQTINKGNYYPASFDKPHNVNFIGNYRISHRYSISLNGIYSTGRPITLPIGTFTLGGSNSLLYSDRNQYRVPDYFRADFSVNIDGNHRIKQRFHNSWSFGVYNLTARQNAYSVYFVQENGQIKGYQLSIFGTAIPFVTYNIKF
ncbi:MAG TPA: carboxypeptidase-like regulatory domain-containing protein [Chitinophagaceae bacterium]|nr:carboxypeptidase-like regulatory domain-containing protein [Chitinophagaceae bacterium]